MSTRSQTTKEATLTATANLTPVRSNLFQRRSACGDHTSDGGCIGRHDSRRMLQQRKVSGLPDIPKVPPIVHEVLESPGQPLDPGIRSFVERRFQHDFSKVRIHANARAAASAQALGAEAYTYGRNIVFGPQHYDPYHDAGLRLLAHELAHTIQQHFTDYEGDGLLLPERGGHEVTAATAARILHWAHPLGPLYTSPPGIARQPQRGTAKGDDEKDVVEDLPAADTLADERVSSIIIDLRRGRVGFTVPAPKGMILGSVSTDLKPGKYTVIPNVADKKWVFKAGQVKEGQRFEVSLEGANPWTLAYPEEIPLLVGFSTERRGGGPAGKTEEDLQADLLRLFDEEHRDIPEDPTIDGFTDYEYVPKWEVRGGVGAYTMVITLKYRNSTREVIDLATVGDAQVPEADRKAALANATIGTSGRLKPKSLNRSTTPNLWDLKQTILRLQKRLREIGEEELLDFTLQHGFPAVFTILTINPFVAPTGPGAGGGGDKRRPPVPSGRGGPRGPGNVRVLVVGAETEAEFAYARGVTAKGQRVDVVNPRVTNAAREFAEEGGTFIQGKIENLPREPTYNVIREDFPYPTGRSATTIEGVGERLARLKSGGRWVVITEEGAEFLPTLRVEAERRGAKVTTYSVPEAHEGAPQSAYPKQPTRFVVIIEKP